MEAGLGFDGAISKLTEHMDGPLADEFALALGEMRIGESRQNALTKMMQRVDTPELSAFVRAIIQADSSASRSGASSKCRPTTPATVASWLPRSGR